MSQEARERDFDFIGPQLPVDWAAKVVKSTSSNPINNRNIYGPVHFGKTPGREEIVVHKKGEVQVISFNATTADLPKTTLGPGAYDVDAGYRLGDEAKGLPFSLAIAREDQIGPKGEKPISMLDVDIDAYQLDLDPQSALQALKKDGRKEGFILYRKDRNQEQVVDDDNPLNDHLGGSWFKGMADEIKSKPAIINFDKMHGRSDLEVIDDKSEAPEGQRLLLEVNPFVNKKSIQEQPMWRDPSTNPRFISVKHLDDQTPLSPKKIMKSVPMMVDMRKQLGRSDAEEEEQIALAHMDDKPDVDIVRAHLQEKDEAIKKAKEGRSSKKGIDMSIQQGRQDVKEREPSPPREYDVTTAMRAVQPRHTKGIGDWSKAIGRPSNEMDLEETSKEELILEPIAQGRRMKEGPRWALQKLPSVSSASKKNGNNELPVPKTERDATKNSSTSQPPPDEGLRSLFTDLENLQLERRVVNAMPKSPQGQVLSPPPTLGVPPLEAPAPPGKMPNLPERESFATGELD